MHPYRKLLYYLRVGADLAVVAISFEVSVRLAYAHSWQGSQPALWIGLLFLEAMWLISSQSTGLYSEFRTHISFGREFVVLMKSVIMEGIAAAVLLFFVKDTPLSRFFLVMFVAALAVFSTGEKFMLKQILVHMRLKGRNLRTVLFVGASNAANKLCQVMDANPQYGYRILGVLNDRKTPWLNGRHLGPLNKLERILDERRIDDVLITLPRDNPEKILKVAAMCERYPVKVQLVPDLFGFLPMSYGLSVFDTVPMISLGEDKIIELQWRALKRLLDIAFSLCVFILLLSWLCPIVAVAIKLSSPGPVFFKQERGGLNGKRFTAIKFRTMRQESSDVGRDGRFSQAKADDPRTTKFGKFLRHTNLDELPQFWNVLKGEMSVVGPRPHATLMDFESKQIAEKYMRRHLVKPGITGWAQIHGYRGEIHSPGDLLRRVDLDIWYVDNWSFLLDIRVILQTVGKIFIGDPNAY